MSTSPPSPAAVPVHVLDSVGYITEAMRDEIVVTGSHGGLSAARYALAARPRLGVFNDAGIGREGAGIAGLALMQEAGCAACTVAHTSARIGEAQSTLDDGVVTHLNAAARALGIVEGMHCREAVARAGG